MHAFLQWSEYKTMFGAMKVNRRKLDSEQSVNARKRNEHVVQLLEVIEVQGTLSRQEIEDVLADGGYSADGRKNLLMELLTELSQADSTALSTEARDVIEQIKTVLDDYQSGRPAAQDLM